MAKRNTGRRASSRKRRPSPGKGAQSAAAPKSAAALAERPKGAVPERRVRRSASSGQGGDGGFRDPGSYGERPQSLWHPWPLSELLILVGMIGAAVALARGPQHNLATLLASVAAVLLGTIEVSLREHMSGYRSHTILLALLPALALHTVVVLLVAAFTRVPSLLNVGMLLVDGAVFTVLFRILRSRFLDARRERVQQLRR